MENWEAMKGDRSGGRERRVIFLTKSYFILALKSKQRGQQDGGDVDEEHARQWTVTALHL